MDEKTKERVIKLAIDGLLTDGRYLKQWYLEQILIALGVNLGKLETYMGSNEKRAQ